MPSVSISIKASCGSACRMFADADSLALYMSVLLVYSFIDLSIGY